MLSEAERAMSWSSLRALLRDIAKDSFAEGVLYGANIKEIMGRNGTILTADEESVEVIWSNSHTKERLDKLIKTVLDYESAELSKTQDNAPASVRVSNSPWGG